MSQRRSILDFPRNEAGLVDEFLGTAFDAVYQIYLNLNEILNSSGYANRAEAAKVAAEAAALAAKLSETNAHASELAAAQSANNLAQAVLIAIDAKDAAKLSALAAAASAEAASAFAAGLLPASEIAPIQHIGGTPLQIGDRYFNTKEQAEYIYTAYGWVANDSLAAIADLANATDPAKGASKVAWDGSTVAEQMDLSKKLASYAALRNYSGGATIVRITNFRLVGNFYVDLADTTSADNGGTTIIDSLGRRWKREFTLVALMEWFGAIADGVTDCTAAIGAANSAGVIIRFSGGIYCAKNLYMTKTWVMEEGAWIKYNGSAPATDWIVKCSGAELSGNLNLDAGGGAPSLMLHMNGPSNTLSRVIVKNLNSTAAPDGGVCAGVKMSNVGNKITTLIGIDLLIAGNANASSPQLLAFAGGSDRCQVGTVTGRNVTSGVVNAAGTGKSSVGYIDLDGAIDNGIYNTSGDLTVGGIRYRGQDEPVVVIGGTFRIGDFIVQDGFNAALAFAACGDITIDNLIIEPGSGIQSLFKTRDVGAVGNVKIGRISGQLDAGRGLCSCDIGTVASISIGEIDLTYTYDAANTGNPTQWGYLTACAGFNIGRVNIKIRDKNDVLTSSDIFRFNFPVSPTKLSVVDDFRIDIVKADGVTPSDAQFYGVNLIHPNVNLNKGLLRTNAGPYLEKVRSTVPGDRLTANVVPTLGTWKQGQILWRAYPTALGSPGWMCVAAGTPGTWGSLPALT